MSVCTKDDMKNQVDVQKLNVLEKSMVKNVKSPVGYFRDWDAITAWAKSIAHTLQEKVT